MIEIKNLYKRYKNNLVLNNLNFKLEKGQILGLLGPNGSGKSTLIKIILNLSKYESGEIIINDEKISQKTNRFISYLSDKFVFDKYQKVKDVLLTYHHFYDDFDLEKAKKLIKEYGISETNQVKELSKGNVEKLQLIVTLSRKTKIYILDEPIAGVDILTRKEIIKLVIDNINEESSAIIVTHLIDDIEKVFDKVCFIKDGSIDKIYDVEETRFVNNKSIEELYIEYFGGVK